MGLDHEKKWKIFFWRNKTTEREKKPRTPSQKHVEMRISSKEKKSAKKADSNSGGIETVEQKIHTL